MGRKQVIIGVVGVTLLLVGYRGVGAFMVAKAVAPPHTSAASIIRRVFHPPFQMATPHRNLIREIRFDLIPSALACGSGECTGFESKPGCGDCNPGFCYCPGCTMNPGCTQYFCTYTNNPRKACQNVVVTDQHSPCYLCENDSNYTCTPIPP
jgi:hypothetical protein